MKSLFRCPTCGGSLERQGGAYRCGRGHSFDLAREGYVNLLPANRRHSRAPGDDSQMVQARARFLDGGWYAPLRDRLWRLFDQYADQHGLQAPILLDAGCGEGYYTAALAARVLARGGQLAGVDISKSAVKRAAKRCPGAELAVASVYRLPLAAGAVDMVVDCFSPLAAEEFHRVLRPGGLFFYVVPGPRHLWEMKELLYDNPYENEEKMECYEGFSYREVIPVDGRFTLTEPQDIQALFRMTPYAWKSPKAGVGRLMGRTQLSITAQFRVHILERA